MGNPAAAQKNQEGKMKVFVWNRIEKCTDSYHSEGGVVVFAKSEVEARALAKKEGCEIAENETPDDIRNVASGKPAVYIMPDAGCC